MSSVFCLRSMSIKSQNKLTALPDKIPKIAGFRKKYISEYKHSVKNYYDHSNSYIS